MSEVAASVNGAMALVRRRPLIVLFFLCFVAWLPGLFTLPPLDRDESRFAQSSKQMLESGNFIDIRFGQVPRYKKPVGIYWLQAASTEVVSVVTGDMSRDRIWTYRVPSLLGAFAAVAGVFWCARAFAGSEASFLAALLLGMTLLLAAEAKIAKTDAVLLASVVATQAVLLRVYLSARDPDRPAPARAVVLAGWAAFAAGILIKGPLIVGVCGVTIVALTVWDREWRWLGRTRPIMGLALTLVVVLPWLVAIAVQSHGQFFEQSLGHDFATKLQGGQETHGAPPGYYLLLTTFSFWPATLFLLPAVGAAVARRGEPAMRFLLAWAGANLLLFELVPTKLPHYILPAYPALAMLAALWALAPRDDAEPRWRRVLFYLAPIQFLLAIAVFAAALILLPDLYGSGTTWWLIAVSCGFAILGIAAAIFLFRRSNLWALACALGCVLIIYPAITLGVAPRLDQLWVSPRAAAAEKKLARSGDPPPALAGYVEPSLVFLLGTETRQTDGRGAAEVGAAQGGLALVEDSERSSFLAHLAELDADASQVGSVSGFNYSRGRHVHIRIYRVAPVREEMLPPAE
ncbi:MAG: glycosyltransferase family 39 protein [Rhizomicrobium sp.]|jgi:4-amino-4-deoxy-L-arabinose transferase-like glycosyltransferase